MPDLVTTQQSPTPAASLPRKKLLWRKLECSLIEEINKGNLKPGDRLPSVREMGRLARVSISTVLQAYLQLEAQGYIQSRTRSGFFVAPRHDSSLDPGAIELPDSRPTQIAAEVIQQIMQSLHQQSVVPFGAATLSMELLPVNQLRRIATKVLRHDSADTVRYQIPPGDELLRQQIARRMALTGVTVSAADVIITSGAMEALSIGLRVLCRAGDAVLVESPTYFGILQCLENLGLRALEIRNSPTTGIDPEHIRAIIKRTRVATALLVPSFNNPTGSLTSNEAKRDIAAMLSTAGIPVIEDDVYAELTFGSVRPIPLKAFDETDNVLLCGSISKTVAPGYRVGWIISKRHRQALIHAKLTTSLATASLEQRVIGEFLRNGFDRHIKKLRNTLAKQVPMFTDAVLRYFPEGTKVSRPRGGYVVWIELPSTVDCLRLMHTALKHGISISPGVIFSATGAYPNFIRLNCGVGWSTVSEHAVQVLGRLAFMLSTNKSK